MTIIYSFIIPYISYFLPSFVLSFLFLICAFIDAHFIWKLLHGG